MYATSNLADPAASIVVEPPKKAAEDDNPVANSTAVLLRCTMRDDTPPEWREPVNYADLERRAHDLRGEYVAAWARRCYAALGRALRRKDSRSQLILP